MEKKFHIQHYTIGDRVCLGYAFNGVIYVLQWLGKRGDCLDTTGKAQTAR